MGGDVAGAGGASSRARLFNMIKAVIYGLLVINIFLYLRHGTLVEALDSLGWVLLLGALEWETRFLGEAYQGTWEKLVLWGMQLVGYGLAFHATIHYYRIGEWADFTNAVLWLLVCASLAYDVFWPGEYGEGEWRKRNWIKGALYLGLFAVAIYWGVTNDWLDFWDALLWILCFFIIEMNVFRHEMTSAPELATSSV